MDENHGTILKQPQNIVNQKCIDFRLQNIQLVEAGKHGNRTNNPTLRFQYTHLASKMGVCSKCPEQIHLLFSGI